VHGTIGAKPFGFARFCRSVCVPVVAVKNTLLFLAAAVSACTAQSSDQSSDSGACPPSLPYACTNQAQGFRICLPAGVKKQTADGYPAGSILFTGFAVPAKTNLISKQLVIVPGEYDALKGAKPFGSFKVNGVTFQRVKFDEGSAGHATLHIVYTWNSSKGSVHFDFAHRAVNVYNFDPPQRPAEYDRASQIAMTGQIMKTFRAL
jgi:hypothetical protein